MEKVAVSVMPITDMGGLKQFTDEISSGSRAEAHREFLRRVGVSAERAYVQPTPMGDLMVLVWEGVDQAEMNERFGDMVQNPQSDHERYLKDVVIPKIHGVDLSQPPPPPTQQFTTVTT
ncbi:hypothetical protein SAMN05216199_1519 [Pedococcus cremeus]|uniref:ABM domain-containing protein n=2 Tax=Pedococcus cremeus TaxID=587636 RepID=A0A1H9TB41_9MICO|nr:hypothetical protein SAMN05216199_1519 [Pedococcus cremeus]